MKLNYSIIGMRLKQARLDKKITQENTRKRKKKSFFVRSVRLRMKFQSQKRYVKDIYRILQAKRNLVL